MLRVYSLCLNYYIIWNHCPLSRSDSCQLEVSLYIGLIKARKKIVTVICCKLGVDILFSICCICKWMHSNTVFSVIIIKVDLHLVFSNNKALQMYFMLIENSIFCHLYSIDSEITNFESSEVKVNILSLRNFHLYLNWSKVLITFRQSEH